MGEGRAEGGDAGATKEEQNGSDDGMMGQGEECLWMVCLDEGGERALSETETETESL